MKDNFDSSILVKNKSKVNGKRKGNNFENKIAKLLNERFGTKEFCRTPGSGAFATTHKLPEHLQIYGDLITPKSFKFIIETKKGYNKERVCDLFNTNSNLVKMIAKANRDSINANKPFLFILAQDNKQPIVISNLIFTSIVQGRFQYLEGCINDNSFIAMKLDDLLSLDDKFFIHS